ncbi:MAG: hypothetical protein C4346_01185 [Chloroflexota bacterium]
MSNSGLRIVFLGMCYVGSPPALQALLQAGYDVRAVVIPGPPGGPPVLELPQPAPSRTGIIPLTTPGQNMSATQPDDELLTLARRHGIPVLAMPTLRHERALAAIAQRAPDLIVASCFPLRVPRAVRDLARLGCLNVHPSLLPRWRGPEPVFWALRAGDEVTGVTIHLMDAGWDTGPIIAQERISWPDGARLPEIERMLSERGAELLLTAIEGLVSGQLVPEPQAAAGATYAPFPQPEDSIITTDWDAAHAYRFARAIAPLQEAITIRIAATGQKLLVADALGWLPDRDQQTVLRNENIVVIPFTSGTVQFRVE